MVIFNNFIIIENYKYENWENYWKLSALELRKLLKSINIEIKEIIENY